MSVNKYANLPDIDTSQDVYETEDVFPTRARAGDSSEDESGGPTRTNANGSRSRGDAGEGLDSSSLISADEAGKKFRKAERKRDHRPRSIFAYPSSSPPSPTSPTHARPLTTRLRSLQAELDSLEAELADPSNPLLHGDDNGEGAQIDPGELMRGLVDVRGRLEKVKKGREGRGRLVGVLLNTETEKQDEEVGELKRELSRARSADARTGEGKKPYAEDEKEKADLAELDRRVGELEELIGSSSIALDEGSPLPAPLLPMLTKLNTQLTLLTQPRHLDSISRRLKLLISDLDRLTASQQHAQAGGRRGQSQQAVQAPAAGAPSALQEQLLPLLARLAPHLPHLPHLLTRMRTLSGLHAAAADVQSTIGALEAEQLRSRGRLDMLSTAVEGVEKSLEENAEVVRGNVGGLEERVEMLVKRLDALG